MFKAVLCLFCVADIGSVTFVISFLQPVQHNHFTSITSLVVISRCRADWAVSKELDSVCKCVVCGLGCTKKYSDKQICIPGSIPLAVRIKHSVCSYYRIM